MIALREIASRADRERTRAERLRAYQNAVERLVRQHGRWNDDQVRAALGLLEDARREIVIELTARIGSEKERFTTDRLTRLRSVIDAVAEELRQALGRHMGAVLYDAWQQGAALLPDALGAIGITVGGTADLSLAQLQVLASLSGDLIERVSDDFRAQASRAIAVGVLAGTPPSAVVQQIADLLRTQPDRQDDRLGSIASQADRLVRTELLGAFNLAAKLRSDEVGATVPDMRKYWASARDGRVREAHAAADARYRPGGSEGPIPWNADYRVGGEQAQMPHDARLSPGMRINCRCVSIGWQAAWFEGEE